MGKFIPICACFLLVFVGHAQAVCAPDISSDIDKNCTFNILDLAELVKMWLSNQTMLDADLNLDNKVDFKDFSEFTEIWRQ